MDTNTEPASDLEVSIKKEDEHLRLQRQVRMIQTDRLQRSMGVHPQFRRQDHLLRILKKDYLNLLKNIKVAKSGANKKNDKRLKADLKKSLEYRTQTEQECDTGLTLMAQLDELLQRKKKQMLELRGSVNIKIGQLEERRQLSEHRLMSTENKLEVAMRRFNVIQCENKKIREEIEHMLKDRALFNQAWTKMLTALNKGKKFLTDLFESSTLAYDQRDEWCTKLKSMQEKGKMDQMMQVQEMRDLQKAYDHEMKLYIFLAKKGVIRINTREEEREEERRRKEEEDEKKNIESHNRILQEIYDYTKIENISKIIEEFDRVEQNNFSVYKLLTHFCAENEVLGKDLQRIRRDIEDRKEWMDMMEEKRQSKLKDLNEQLEQQKIKTEEKRQKEAEVTERLKTAMASVEEIFKMLECSLEPFQNLLGDKQPSLHHLDLTFRLITEKINELLQLSYYQERCLQRTCMKTSRLKTFNIQHQFPRILSEPNIDRMVTASPCPACVETRWMSRVSEKPEQPFDAARTLAALAELAAEPAFVRSDRVHPLTDCRVPQSRLILAKRYNQL